MTCKRRRFDANKTVVPPRSPRYLLHTCAVETTQRVDLSAQNRKGGVKESATSPQRSISDVTPERDRTVLCRIVHRGIGPDTLKGNKP